VQYISLDELMLKRSGVLSKKSLEGWKVMISATDDLWIKILNAQCDMSTFESSASNGREGLLD